VSAGQDGLVPTVIRRHAAIGRSADSCSNSSAPGALQSKPACTTAGALPFPIDCVPINLCVIAIVYRHQGPPSNQLCGGARCSVYIVRSLKGIAVPVVAWFPYLQHCLQGCQELFSLSSVLSLPIYYLQVLGAISHIYSVQCTGATCMVPVWMGCASVKLAGAEHTAHLTIFTLYRCHVHGACVDGVCLCEAGWGGAHCTLDLCPAACSGHGK
jgi:hypothetical protein